MSTRSSSSERESTRVHPRQENLVLRMHAVTLFIHTHTRNKQYCSTQVYIFSIALGKYISENVPVGICKDHAHHVLDCRDTRKARQLFASRDSAQVQGRRL